MHETDELSEADRRNTDLVQQTVETIQPLLAVRSPEIQGAALADLLAIYIAGHSPEQRLKLMCLHIETLSKLVDFYDQTREACDAKPA